MVPDPPEPSPEARSIEPASPPWFQDVTKQMGLNFVHEAGPTGKYFMPQLLGSGGFFDLDDDGRLDLYLLQNGGPESGVANRLFRQGADGRFVDMGKGSGLDIAGYSMGVAIGDVNNDGRPDVLVTQYGGVRLFLNHGAGRSRMSLRSKLASRSGEHRRHSSTTIATAGSTWLSSTTSTMIPPWCAGPEAGGNSAAPQRFRARSRNSFATWAAPSRSPRIPSVSRT